MKAAELISHLHSLDVKLWLDGDRLRYSAPRGVMSQALLEELAEHKEGVRQFLKRAHGAVVDSSAPALVVSREGELPLSFAQQRMWLINQLAPASAAYNVATALRLEGALNLPALEQALEEISRRHEVLRTTFVVVEGRPRQVISPPHGRALLMADLRALTEAERRACVHRLASQHAEYPFDLSEGPLLIATLLRLSESEHVLLLTTHHIVSDGWSLSVLTREALSLYAAFSAGRPSPLAGPHIQYADFAVWQRKWLEGGALEKQLDYWRRQLADLPPALELPTDRARPAVQTNRGADEPFVLSRELTDELKALGRREGATLFMVLLAAFQTLLYRYTRQTDIPVGTPIANRNRAETEGLIGFFVNTLVLRAKLEGGESFVELLRRVREVTLGAYAHQDVPFEKLVEELQPERDTSRSALFQVMLSFQNVPREELDAPGLKASQLDAAYRTAKFDLTLEVNDSKPELHCLFEYNTDLFDAATIRRMTAHLRTLLESIARSPRRPLAELPLLTEEERVQLLAAWNDTSAAFPDDKAVHQLFEAQVAAKPDAFALCFGAEHLTYAELNARANRLAHRLRGMGVGPEVMVGVCLERSAEMVVALLAVLKAGGAYVPLDPRYPQERLDFMLADSRAAVLVTAQEPGVQFGGQRCRLLCLEAQSPSLAALSPADPAPMATPENLAYVIYTSGSTGTPKGVGVTHRSVSALARWAREVLTDEELSGVLFSTSVCFDVSVFELFVPLCWGGTVIMWENALEPPAPAPGAPVTLVSTVPSVMNEMLRLGLVPPSARTVILAGEALPKKLARRIYQLGTVEKLYNFYGPTEDTVYSTFQLVPRTVDCAPPIGRPIANTRVYVLDAALRPVPIGVGGELYLGGDGLARGYLHRPELTAERFIPDPFASPPGGRLYRTGDRVRWLADGCLDFFGRADQQIKLRGFRIEPGEIEAALSRIEGVSRAVVAVRAAAEGEEQLVAYVVTEPGRRPTVSELLEQTRDKLPEYMVPSAFVFLEEMPRSPGGKIDRRALPAPDGKRPDLRQTFTAPLTEVEKTIAAVWREVLRLDSVSVHDNFFDLGGHSLLMVQAREKLAKAFSRELPLVDLFRYSTVNSLAKHLGGDHRPESSRSVSRSEKLEQGKDRLRQLRLRGRGRRAEGTEDE